MKTVSLKLAQELKEAGFPQDKQSSYWMWFVASNGEPYLEKNIVERLGDESAMFSAPAAEELLEKLPAFAQFEKESLPFSFRIEKEIGGNFPDEFVVFYVRYSKTLYSERDYQERGRTTNESLAEAAGKIWLYLKEKNLLPS